MKGFVLGLALKQRRKATRKSPIIKSIFHTTRNNVSMQAARVAQKTVSEPKRILLAQLGKELSDIEEKEYDSKNLSIAV